MHASQIQGYTVEQRIEKKRKIAESVLVHNVVTVRTGKVAGQCAMPYTPRWHTGQFEMYKPFSQERPHPVQHQMAGARPNDVSWRWRSVS